LSNITSQIDSNLSSNAGIIYYDAMLVRRMLTEYGWEGIPVEYRRPGGEAERRLYQGYDELSRFFETICLIDRTNTLEHFLRVENVCPMPDLSKPHRSFESVALTRADQLVRKGKDIVVFWSGGIDSTATILALTLAGARNLKIVMTHLSIIENRAFYERFIRDCIDHEIATGDDVRQNYTLGPNQILVTGENGDQLFGSMVLYRYTMTELQSPWEKFEPCNRLKPFVKPIFDNAPIKLPSLFHFIWWLNMTLKWHNVKFRFIARAEKLCTLDQMHHFFDDEDFQRWAILTDEPKILNTHQTYKWTAKQFIHRHTRDDDFLHNKMKVPSLRVNNNSSNPTFLFSDGRRVALDIPEDAPWLLNP
jgi:hypothetical protein